MSLQTHVETFLSRTTLIISPSTGTRGTFAVAYFPEKRRTETTKCPKYVVDNPLFEVSSSNISVERIELNNPASVRKKKDIKFKTEKDCKAEKLTILFFR